MVHSFMFERNMQRHVSHLLTPTQMKNHLDQARVERSLVFRGLVGSVNSRIKKFVVNIGG
jgi:hypothetical protein